MLCMFFWGHICKSPCHAGCYAAMQVFFRQDLKDLNDLNDESLRLLMKACSVLETSRTSQSSRCFVIFLVRQG